MVQKTQVHISADELKKVSFDCPHCHAEFLLDVENMAHKGFLRSGKTSCPICGEDIKDLFTIFELLDSYIVKIGQYKQKIYFVFDAPKSESRPA